MGRGGDGSWQKEHTLANTAGAAAARSLFAEFLFSTQTLFTIL